MRPIGIDLFAGAGGLSLGFEKAGFDIVAAVEIDPIHCATHEFNFPYCKTICRSIAEVTGDDVRRLSGIGGREIDVVFGGAPCQGFSLIGKRALDDPRNELVYHFVRLVLDLRPAYFVFENVRGLTIGQHREFLEEIISAFRKANYEILLPYQVLNAADFGVPQDRRRLFLIGARSGNRLPFYPRPARNRITVSEAIADLPDADNFPELLERDWTRVEFGSPSAYAGRLRDIDSVLSDFGYRRKFDRDVMTSSLRTAHTPISRKRFSETLCGKTEPISRFLKLDPEGICNTLRAGTASDRGAFTSPRPIHPYFPRCITNREAARLHSYPDWFRFHVTKWHGFRQIGNSVPPLLAQAVATEIVRAAGIRPTVPERILKMDEPTLLEMSMMEASSRYGVPSTVIPKRTRKATVAEVAYA